MGRTGAALLVALAVLGVGACDDDTDAGDASSTTVGAASSTTTPEPAGDQTPPRGTNGLAFDEAGTLWVADLVGEQVLRVDPDDGTILARYGEADGVPSADDVAVGEDGAVWFTDLTGGGVGRIDPDTGSVEIVAELPAPGPNPIAFSPDGRLAVGLAAPGSPDDALYEIDPAGDEPPRLVAEDLGPVNAFAFADEDVLYAPRFGLDGTGALVRIDFGSGAVTEVTDGFGFPVAVRIADDGSLFLAQAAPAQVFTVDPGTGATTEVGTPGTPVVDNFAIAEDGALYLSSYDRATITVMGSDGTVERTFEIGTA